MNNPAIGRQIDATQRASRHKFDKHIVTQIGQYLETNNYNGVFEVIEDWSIIALSVVLTLYAYKLSTALGILSYFIALVIIGGRHRALADILHQASHGAAAKNEYLNFSLGTFFSGYTVFQSFSIYTASHVKLHHPWVGNSHKDPDYIGYISNNICGVNRSKQRTKEYVLSIISPTVSYNYLCYLIKNRIYDKNENKKETVVRLIYWIFIFHTLISNGWIVYFILFWIIPLVTSNVWIGSLLELLEHFPMMDDDNIPFLDILLSKNRIWSAPVNFILGVHNEGYHLVHHLFPKLPSWHYISVHDLLMKDESYAKLDHAEEGCINMVKQIIENSDNLKKKQAQSAVVHIRSQPNKLKKHLSNFFYELFVWVHDRCRSVYHLDL